MEENNKYYTPKITDIRVGYELETNDPFSVNDSFGGNPGEWVKVVLDEDNFQPDRDGDSNISNIFWILNNNKQNIRVPYLSKKDIIKEGWKNFSNTKKFIKEGVPRKGSKIDGTEYTKIVPMELEYNFEDHTLGISYKFGDIYDAYIFNGKCLSINEFKYITRELLGIE